MQPSATRLRTVAVAMLVVGFLVEVAGVALLAMDRPVAAPLAVLVAGLLLVMLAVVFLAQGRR